MFQSRAYFFTLLQLVIFVLSLVTDWYVPLSFGLMIVLLISLLDKLGKGIVLREMIAFHGCFVCLAMPVLGYALYNQTNTLSRKWVRYMPINEDIYFNFALPAIAAFVLILCWPISKKNASDEGVAMDALINRTKNILLRDNMRSKGIYLLVIGVVAFFLSGFLPVSLRFISLLFYFSAFAGVLYVYFSPNFKYKIPTLIIFSLFIIGNALRSGMFTIVAYMSITIFSILFVGKNIRFWKKTTFFALGIFTLLLIQSIKPDYRSYTWRNKYEGNKSELFLTLMTEKIMKGDIFSKDAFFWIYFRTNQGFNVALVMRRMPKIQPHDGGVNLLRSAASSVVPRFLWPDKPEAGGKFNMRYYAGITLRGWSTNIGPLGEAYGSFGVSGGIFYMVFLGFFIRWAYRRVLVIARRIPLLIFWLPVLFYEVTYSMETDSLQILNSLIKASFFVWLLYKISSGLFGEHKQNNRPVKKMSIPPVSPEKFLAEA